MLHRERPRREHLPEDPFVGCESDAEVQPQSGPTCGSAPVTCAADEDAQELADADELGDADEAGDADEPQVPAKRSKAVKVTGTVGSKSPYRWVEDYAILLSGSAASSRVQTSDQASLATETLACYEFQAQKLLYKGIWVVGGTIPTVESSLARMQKLKAKSVWERYKKIVSNINIVINAFRDCRDTRGHMLSRENFLPRSRLQWDDVIEACELNLWKKAWVQKRLEAAARAKDPARWMRLMNQPLASSRLNGVTTRCATQCISIKCMVLSIRAGKRVRPWSP